MVYPSAYAHIVDTGSLTVLYLDRGLPMAMPCFLLQGGLRRRTTDVVGLINQMVSEFKNIIKIVAEYILTFAHKTFILISLQLYKEIY